MPPGFYIQKTQDRFIGGVGLVHMITRIQKVAATGPFIIRNFDKYYVQLKLAEERLSH